MFTVADILALKSLFDVDDPDYRRRGLVALRGYEQQLLESLDQQQRTTNEFDCAPSSARIATSPPVEVLGRDVATTILACACGTYPVLDDDAMSPADMLVQLLWASPDSVSAAQIKDAYLIATRPVRRSLLHLLSLHSSEQAVTVLAHLVGPTGPRELAPAPIRVLLAPLLRHIDTDRIGNDVISRELVPTAVWLCSQPDWVFEATRFLKAWCDVAQHSPLGLFGVAEKADINISAALQTLSDQMQVHIAACNHYWDVTQSSDFDAATSPWAQAALTDPVRGDRFRIEAMLEVVESFAMGPHDAASVSAHEISDQACRVAHRVLMSADPQVSAMGAVTLLRTHSRVGLDRLGMIVRDPAARQRLYDGLHTIPNWVDHTDAVPGEYPDWWTDQRLRAESGVVAWLCEVTQLGCPPHEIEWIATVDSATEFGSVDVFRFRMRDPHWSTGRGWMIAVGGPVVRSDFEAEDEWSLEDHVQLLISRSTLGDL